MKKLLIASALATTLAACSSDSPTELMAMAQEALAKNEVSTAEIHLKNLLLQDGTDGEARLLLANVYLKAGNWPSAEKEFSPST